MAPSLPTQRFRFAPSPNGPLHLGHAYSVLCNLKIARQLGGEVLLRIDDLDQSRARKAYEQSIMDDCRWLGMALQEPLRRQSEHMPSYAAALQRLDDMGLIYRAFASRKQLRDFASTHNAEWPHDPDGAPHFARLAAFTTPPSDNAEPTSWRLDMQKALAIVQGPLHYQRFDPETGACENIQADPTIWGDVALATRDLAASYHLAVVVDDDAQAITHCVRGKDLAPATALHCLLQNLLGLQAPAYHHHDLILGGDGKKLAKSLNAAPLSQWRAEGKSPQDIQALCEKQRG